MKRRIKIRIAPPTAIFFILLILLDRTALSLIPFLAAFCHELGHLAVMRAFKVDVRDVIITIFGAEIRTPMYCKSELARAAVYAAGSMANIISALAVALLGFGGAYAELFVACSFALAFINLLPIRSLDGGCILEALISHFAPNRAYTAVTVISAISLVLLWLVATYILLLCSGNLSLMLFCGCLFAQLFLR